MLVLREDDGEDGVRPRRRLVHVRRRHRPKREIGLLYVFAQCARDCEILVGRLNRSATIASRSLQRA